MAITDTISEAVNSAKELLLHGATDHADEHDPDLSNDDAVEILKKDHRNVEALFKEILAEKSLALTAQRKNIAAVLAELTLHAKIEESIVYPAVYGKTKRDSDERLDVLEAVEEHGSMKELIKKIKKSTGRDESLKAKVQVLSEITEHHVREEESTFFPQAKKLLGEKRLKEIGQEILKLKARARRGAAPAGSSAKRPHAKVGRKK